VLYVHELTLRASVRVDHFGIPAAARLALASPCRIAHFPQLLRLGADLSAPGLLLPGGVLRRTVYGAATPHRVRHPPLVIDDLFPARLTPVLTPGPLADVGQVSG